MAHVDITGLQHYTHGIGQPKADVNNSQPLSASTDNTLPGLGLVVVSSSAPSNADGRPDGTIYIQTV